MDKRTRTKGIFRTLEKLPWVHLDILLRKELERLEMEFVGAPREAIQSIKYREKAKHNEKEATR